MAWLNRLWNLARTRGLSRGVDDELQFHLDARTRDNIEAGMTADQARLDAARRFGNRMLAKERTREMDISVTLESFLKDFGYALRTLRHNPMFSAVALLTLAIGIGANTAVFSVVNSILLRPLSYPQPDELVALRQTAPGAAGLGSFVDGLRLSPSMYFTYAEKNHSFQALGVWFPAAVNVTGLGEPERVRTVLVSDGVLEALGVPPAAGRWFSSADQDPRGRETVVLSFGYWERHFGQDPSAVGRTVNVDARPREIVGVTPRGFRIVNADFDVLIPLAFDRGKLILAGFGFQGIARLKPGVTIVQANADVTRMLPIWMDSWTNGPGSNPRIYETWRITPALRPLKQEVVGGAGNVLWIVMATLGIVMLIVCANVANLLLVRAEARRQELAVRAALGAGRGRIVRQLLLECVTLSLAGGVAGVALAYAGLRFLAAIGPATLPRRHEISLDARALAFTLVLALVSGLLFGLIPALRKIDPRVGAARTSSASRERHRARGLLVVAQVAMAVVLLVSAGLMIRTFHTLRTVEPGFTDAGRLQTMQITIPDSLVKEPQLVMRIQHDVLNRLAVLPGVASVGFASSMPMEGIEPEWDAIYAEGKNYPEEEIPPMRMFKYVSPGFFCTAGTRLAAGRDLTWEDVYGFHPVVIVSENLARELWGSPQSALGKRIREFPKMQWHEVIGVVQDVHENGVHEKTPETVYWPSMMQYLYGSSKVDVTRTLTYAIRSGRAGSQALLNEVRQAVWSVNASLPLASVRTMQEIYDRSMARTSFTLVMLALAGAMALALGVVGIYGVIAYAVSQRRREIGIRLALGAQPGELRRMFVRYGIGLAGIGVAIGLGAATAVMRVMKSLLFGISPLDPLTFAAVPLVLAAAAVLASYIPARQAAAVDPAETLRMEN